MIKFLISFLAVIWSMSNVMALEKITYIFPTIDTAPAFAPFQIAKAKKYYESEGLEVTFVVGKGGADVAKQVGIGNADLGGGIGDTSIIVRANDIPVRGVALLGGQALHQIIVRKDSGIGSLGDLKGKKIGVVAFQDTSYYNILAALASVGVAKSGADIQSVGVSGIVKLMISGDLQAICGAPEWASIIEESGIPIEILSLNQAFPAMAQAILASDKMIASRPEAIRKFVRATLKAVKEIELDHKAAAVTYVETITQYRGRERFIESILGQYAKRVYPVQQGAILGAFDTARMSEVQKFYIANRIVERAVPVQELFTNDFLPR